MRIESWTGTSVESEEVAERVKHLVQIKEATLFISSDPAPGWSPAVAVGTHYEAQTHFNGYASLWGEVFLGDVQANVLEIIRQRAEAQPAR